MLIDGENESAADSVISHDNNSESDRETDAPKEELQRPSPLPRPHSVGGGNEDASSGIADEGSHRSDGRTSSDASNNNDGASRDSVTSFQSERSLGRENIPASNGDMTEENITDLEEVEARYLADADFESVTTEEEDDNKSCSTIPSWKTSPEDTETNQSCATVPSCKASTRGNDDSTASADITTKASSSSSSSSSKGTFSCEQIPSPAPSTPTRDVSIDNESSLPGKEDKDNCRESADNIETVKSSSVARERAAKGDGLRKACSKSPLVFVPVGCTAGKNIDILVQKAHKQQHNSIAILENNDTTPPRKRCETLPKKSTSLDRGQMVIQRKLNEQKVVWLGSVFRQTKQEFHDSVKELPLRHIVKSLPLGGEDSNTDQKLNKYLVDLVDMFNKT